MRSRAGVKQQFDIWSFDFPGQGAHPCVLISHPDICARSAVVNVLDCTSQKQSRTAYPYEALLDVADGLSWETFCDCATMYAVDSTKLFNRRGQVILERRCQIRQKLRDLFRLLATD